VVSGPFAAICVVYQLIMMKKKMRVCRKSRNTKI
nr:hypothetical protein [Tanacetum cinerariifolium]